MNDGYADHGRNSVNTYFGVTSSRLLSSNLSIHRDISSRWNGYLQNFSSIKRKWQFEQAVETCITTFQQTNGEGRRRRERENMSQRLITISDGNEKRGKSIKIIKPSVSTLHAPPQPNPIHTKTYVVCISDIDAMTKYGNFI